MTGALLLAFIGFATAISITPGPNNTMLLASGANFGFVRTLPHLAGIAAGTMLMVLLVGLGLGRLLEASPPLYALLRYAGALYLLVLAWRLARARAIKPGPKGGDGRHRPMRFADALLFQGVNPKAWVMVVGAVTTYAPRDGFVRNVLTIAAVLPLVSIPCIALWAGCGVAMRRVLDRPSRVRAFNMTMAILLVMSLYPVLID